MSEKEDNDSDNRMMTAFVDILKISDMSGRVSMAAVIMSFREFSDSQRVAFIGVIDDFYCIHCGWEKKGKVCHCTNDD